MDVAGAGKPSLNAREFHFGASESDLLRGASKNAVGRFELAVSIRCIADQDRIIVHERAVCNVEMTRPIESTSVLLGSVADKDAVVDLNETHP